MNCHEAEPHLSSYYDRQLTGNLQQAVAAHVGECPSCRRELETFASLSRLTKSSFAEVEELDSLNLQTPEDLWSRIEGSLPEGAKNSPRAGSSPTVVSPQAIRPENTQIEAAHLESSSTHGRFWWGKAVQWERAVLAALLVIAMGVGIFWYQGRTGHHHSSQGRLEHYVKTFMHDSQDAQRTLVADYGAQRVERQELSKRLGYQPMIPNRLPEGYLLKAIYVFEMNCCNCAQYVCIREGDEPITFFEHGEAHAAHLAGCSTHETICHGQRCQLGEMGKQWIASWQVGPRQITVVGAHDVEEVEQLVAHFRQPSSSQTEQGA